MAEVFTQVLNESNNTLTDTVSLDKTLTSNILNEISIPTVDINITYSELESNIAILKDALNTIRNSWNGITKINIHRLNRSWVGDDCAAYIEKVQSMDANVNNATLAIELLIRTYEKAKNQILEQQNKITSTINSVE